MMRAMTSVLPPGTNGTTSRIGFTGQAVWHSTGTAYANSAAAMSVRM